MPSHHRHRSGKSRRAGPETEPEPEETEENDVVDPQLYAQYPQQEEYEQETYILEGNEDDIYSAEDQVQANYTCQLSPVYFRRLRRAGRHNRRAPSQ